MFYVFHGQDTFSKKETLDGLLGKLGDRDLLELNTSELAGAVSRQELEQACGVVPFLAPARVVYLKGLAAARPGAGQWQEILAYLPQVPETTRLVIMEDESLPSNHPLIKAAKQADNGFVKEFAPREGLALEQWIRDRAQAKGKKISGPAAALLASSVGTDLATLDNELEKLVMYGQNREAAIGPEDVALLSPFAIEASIFALVDGIGARDGQVSARLLQRKLREGASPAYLMAMIVRQYRLLILAKELAEAGARPQTVAGKLHVPGFVAGKLLEQCRRYSMEQLEQVYDHLLQVDVAVKTGESDLTTELALLVAAVAATT